MMKKQEIRVTKEVHRVINEQGQGDAWIIDPENGFAKEETMMYDANPHEKLLMIQQLVKGKDLVAVIQDTWYWDEGGQSVYIFLASPDALSKIQNMIDIMADSGVHASPAEYVWDASRKNPEEWVIICSGPY